MQSNTTFTTIQNQLRIVTGRDSKEVEKLSHISSLLKNYFGWGEDIKDSLFRFINQQLIKNKLLLVKLWSANSELRGQLLFHDYYFSSSRRFSTTDTEIQWNFPDYFEQITDENSRHFLIENWKKVLFLLATIYDPQEGLFRKIQDVFALTTISNQEAARLLGKRVITNEELSYLRALSIESYISKYHLPSSYPDNHFLGNFEKCRSIYLNVLAKSFIAFRDPCIVGKIASLREGKFPLHYDDGDWKSQLTINNVRSFTYEGWLRCGITRFSDDIIFIDREFAAKRYRGMDVFSYEGIYEEIFSDALNGAEMITTWLDASEHGLPLFNHDCFSDCLSTPGVHHLKLALNYSEKDWKMLLLNDSVRTQLLTSQYALLDLWCDLMKNASSEIQTQTEDLWPVNFSSSFPLSSSAGNKKIIENEEVIQGKSWWWLWLLMPIISITQMIITYQFSFFRLVKAKLSSLFSFLLGKKIF